MFEAPEYGLLRAPAPVIADEVARAAVTCLNPLPKFLGLWRGGQQPWKGTMGAGI